MKPTSLFVCLLALLINTNQCSAQLSADFSATNTSGCSPIVVNFTDESEGSPSEWRWDLGNGTISTLQNPSATYFAPGFYTVKLWIRSGNNTDSAVKINYIHVFNSPVVDFSAVNPVGCSPLAVTFNDHSSLTAGNIISRQWDFGDGVLSEEQTPHHVYTLPGSFNVTLKVIAANGCSGTLRKSSYIVNNNARAAFKNWSVTSCTPNKIYFQNESAGSDSLYYSWQFGDGTFSSELNPIHLYTTPGVYTVELFVRGQSGCTDSTSKNVTINAPLKASFTADNLINCRIPAPVQFTSQTPGTYTCYWSFGDSTTSSGTQPLHIYNDTGFFSVKLVVKDAAGCSDSLVIPNYIKVQKVQISLPGLPDSGCAPLSKQFIAAPYSYDSIVNYTWNFGNGIVLNGPSPAYTFSAAGIYNLSLVTTSSYGCVDTTEVFYAVTVGNKPTAGFSANILNDCASTIISFTDQSIGNVTSWEWDFGDLGVSTERNPSYVYADTGWMDVQLTVSDRGCTDQVTHSRYIYLKPSVAKFKTVIDCNTPYNRTFTNFSLGATRWQWDFGDGTTSTVLSPVHTFPRAGSYTVVLYTWNDSTGCTYSHKQIIKITDVIADFFTTDTSICKDNSVSFTATAHPDIVNYTWDFGDGRTLQRTSPAATHIYRNAGTYSVKLVVKDSVGCKKTIIKNNYILVNGPVARFASPAYNICINSPVVFIDSSTAPLTNRIKKWEWNYGDGTRDTLFSPPFTHIYTQAGTYTPSVKITDSLGCISSFSFVRPVKAGKILPFFFVSDSVACPGYALKFVCPFSEPGVTYRWDFGDGQTATQQIPFHAFAREGTYTVKLLVSKTNSCTDSMIIVNAVKVKQTLAAFTLSDTFSSCPPLLVGFTSNSVNAVSEFWSFGDSTYANTVNPSHYYTYPGEYNAILYAKGRGGCIDSVTKKIIIKGPTGTITANHLFSCKPYAYNFIAHTQNTTSYVWDYDDGVTSAGNDSVVNHVYMDSGKFLPRIILKDNNGCRVPVYSKDSLTNIFIKPAFVVSDSIVCGNETVSFTNLSKSNDLLTSFVWHFGDSVFSNQRNSSHHYSSTGNFYPSLKVTSQEGCIEHFTSAVPVKVIPSPLISMTASGNGCAPLQVTVSAVNNSTNTLPVNWKWDMGNGDSSVLQNPPVQTYTSAGNYTIHLTAVNTEGCRRDSQTVITVYPSPLTTIHGDSSLCQNQPVFLQAGGADKYIWSPTTGLSCDTCAVTMAQPMVTTQYILKGISLQGCSSNDTLQLKVYQPIHINYNRTADICKGKDVTLSVSGADSYKWSPPYGLSNTLSSKPVANPDTSTTYTVVGSDSHGCFTDTGKVDVIVHPYPIVKACDDKTVALGTPVLLEAIYSADVTQVNWYPTDNVSRYGENDIMVKPTENTEYTVKVKNNAGCVASDKVTVFVTCNKNNVFVPNLFSPNNDGVNDVFYPRGTGLLKVQTLRIFNRWGETVFEKKSFNANDPSAGWDGTYKGSKLISDVFVYVMDLVCENNSVLSLRGNISLVK